MEGKSLASYLDGKPDEFGHLRLGGVGAEFVQQVREAGLQPTAGRARPQVIRQLRLVCIV